MTKNVSVSINPYRRHINTLLPSFAFLSRHIEAVLQT